jgi:enediyne biosynthesis protein E4
MRIAFLFHVFIAVVCFTSCFQNNQERLFTQLSPAASGIHFNNELHDADTSRSFINEFGYMGGGVGIGDFNNDGLRDIFFTGNQVSCRLYINQGKNNFKDITGTAGVSTDSWCTGVSIADVNNDGYDDIYVSVFGKDLSTRSGNLLFINQGNLSFKEQAEEYGLADSGYSSQAAFFDYDRDGDLDMYLANYLLSSYNTNSIFPRDRSGHSPANDRLFRNDGDSAKIGHPVFKDVSLQAGIKEDGFGLGLSVSDFNKDGWPDVYVANDFISNDVLWLNNRNGTFTNCIDKSLGHQSYSSMGSDAADINNDSWPDVVTLDMLPEYNERKKMSFSFMNYERYNAERAMGYEPEFMRNMLQLNNGNWARGDTSIPFFSEIGRLSGIEATDWSWSVLLADFDNDGWKDIHITNGIGRDFINADFLEFSNQVFQSNSSREAQQKAIREKLASLDNVNLPNYLYINQHDLRFSDESAMAGINEPAMSNGAAHADLDNDGDLDLVVNNINKKAFVFINNTNGEEKRLTAHFVGVQLQGHPFNRRGIGSRITVYNNGKAQLQEQYPTRGYFSSVDQQLLFGIGDNRKVDSLVIVWPDERKQVLTNLSGDSTIILDWQNARTADALPRHQPSVLFSDITSHAGISYLHQENELNEYASQRLLPQGYSKLGPFISTGDMNQDGRDDFFIGGAFNFSGKLFMQQNGERFISRNLIDSIKFEEDMDCILFDADADGDQDLLVTCGDTQYEAWSMYYKPRLYINDGKGNFNLSSTAIPDSVRTIAGCVSGADYDHDGDIDLFIGGRVSKTYPFPARSFLLQNDRGIFRDVTETVCPSLLRPGMVTSAVWADFDGDKKTDLIIAGEWMPVRFFRNNHGSLSETTASTTLTEMNGMWRSLVANDIDNDGDVDLVAGNLGLNCEYRVSASTPMQLFAADLDDNGSIDPLLSYYIKAWDGKRHPYPALSRGRLAEQVPSIKKRFLFNVDYARATLNEIFKGKNKTDMLKLYCDETRTCFLENTGKGKFVKHPLPIPAQIAPVNTIICDDLDGDGFKDLLLAGNEYGTEVTTGRDDASYGCFLRGTVNKSFIPIPPIESGFMLKGDVRDMSLLHLPDGKKIILAAVNNDALRVFKISTSPR